MTDLQIRLLRHALIILLGGSYLICSTILILMLIPPFTLFGCFFLPTAVGCSVVGAYCIAWLAYLSFAQTDREFNVPYNPKRIIKVNYAIFQALWASIFYLPLLAEYGYLRFFVLRKKLRRIIKEDIFYGSQTNTNRLDVYIPDTAKLQQQFFDKATHPVIVFIYGGAWGSGDKIMYSLLALRLRHLGYVVVVPNYTLYPNFGRKDISTGAHLASLVTIRDAIIKSQTNSNLVAREFTNLEDIDPELELPKIHGLILLSGVFDISRHFIWESNRGVEEISAMARVMGGTQESFALNSPTTLIENALKSRDINMDKLKRLMPAKILFIHGNKDKVVPLESTLRFNGMLNELNIKDLRLRIPAEMAHSDSVTGFMYSPFKNNYTSQLLYELADFMSC
ncbi:13236_t:CDS:2 [Rhizophagus irregularis]|nr:13236_t:CDS:2 [Rhizophagus irregularis]